MTAIDATWFGVMGILLVFLGFWIEWWVPLILVAAFAALIGVAMTLYLFFIKMGMPPS